jgi:trimeric autotransporter adhesin
LVHRRSFGLTTANQNTATGAQALKNNNANTNTAVGYPAQFLADGLSNTSIGYQALYHSGNDNNTAVGSGALFNNNAGIGNIALGVQAGFNITDGSENIDIGNAGLAGDANTIRIGTVGTHLATFIAGISGAVVTGTAVVVDANGQLGVAPSSGRFKTDIKPIDKASEAILALQPVTFRYNKQIDGARTAQFGLVAEEVEKVNRDLVSRDEKGNAYTVRYDAVNAMLLNEFLKAHRKIGEQQDAIAELKSGMETLAAALKQQATEMHAMRAQLQMSKMPPQVVANP